MAVKSPKAGQSFRLTPNGLWTCQDVLPFWSGDSKSDVLKLKKDIRTNQTAQSEWYSGGINIRVEADEEIRRRQVERTRSLVDHDHTYYKKDLFSKKKSKGINDLVMRAIAGVQDEPTPKKGEVSEVTRNSQLYKYLTTPIDNRRRTGEAFGHSLVRDIIRARPPHVSSHATTAFRFRNAQTVNHPVASSSTSHTTTSMTTAQDERFSCSWNVPPPFLNLDQKYWTREQCAEYEQWWQQLPSCQFAYCCGHGNGK